MLKKLLQKKLLALILAVFFVATLVPVTALAADTYTFSDFSGVGGNDENSVSALYHDLTLTAYDYAVDFPMATAFYDDGYLWVTGSGWSMSAGAKHTLTIEKTDHSAFTPTSVVVKLSTYRPYETSPYETDTFRVKGYDASNNVIASLAYENVTTLSNVSVDFSTFANIYKLEFSLDYNDFGISSLVLGTSNAAPTTTVVSASLSDDTGTSPFDFITKTAGQTISGTLSAALATGEKVQVSYDNGSAWSDATTYTVGSTAWSTTTTLSGSDTFRARVSNAYGSSTAYTHTYTLDSIAPTMTFIGLSFSVDTGISNSDLITNTSAQTISASLSATLDAGDVAYGSLNNGSTWTNITSRVSGTTLTWTGAALLTGTNVLLFKVTDAAGNDGTVFSKAYTLDTTAPTTTIAMAAFSADSGTPADFITNTASQTISGTLSANLATGETVYVSLNNGSTYSTATAAEGQSTWSLSGQTLSSSGTLKVKVTDIAGNDGTVFRQEYIFDTTLPAVGGVTNNAHYNSGVAATFSEGTATLKKDTDAPSSYTSETTISADGSYELIVTDVAGNANTVRFTIDRIAPYVTDVSAISADGTYKAGDTISVTVPFSENVAVTGTPQLTLETGATDRVANFVSGSGTNTLTFTYTVQAGDTSADLDYASASALALNGGTIKDASGNNATLTLATPGAAGSLGANKAIVVDAVAPTVSSVAVPSNATYISGQDLDFTVNFSEPVTVNFGGGTPRIALTIGSTTCYAAYLSGSGTSALVFRYTVQAGNVDSDGITVGALSANGSTLCDAVGNNATLTLSSVGSTSGVLVDGIPVPAAPSVPDMTTASDTGASSTDNITSNAAPTFTGTAAATGTVTLYDTDGTTVLGTGTADGSGSWSITTSTLSDGTHTIIAKVTLAGKTSVASSSLSVTIDTSAPSVPSAPDLTAASDTGSSNTDDITGNTMPTFTGTAEAGTMVVLYDTDGTTVLGAATADGSGNWSITTTTLSAGAHTVKAMATDAAGNTSAASSSVGVTIDTAAPSAPSAPDMTAASDTGSSNTDDITGNTTPTFTGTAEGGTVVVLFDTDGTTVLGTATADGIGNWSITTTTLSAGAHTVKAKATDAAGNTSAASAGLSITISTTAPTTTVTTAVFSADTGSSSSDFITKTADQTISGTLSANLASGETVEISLDNGGTWTTATATVGQNTWSLSGQILSGSNTMKARVANASGASGTVLSQAYVLDTTVPDAPVITTASQIMNADSINVTGTAEIGTTIAIGGGAAAAAGTAVDGAYTLGVSLTQNTVNTLTITATDAAGNVSTMASVVITEDSNSPTVSVRTITTSDVTTSAVKLTWTAATDGVTAPAQLQYKVVYSASSNISMPGDAEANGTVSTNWTANLTTATVIGLTANTDYNFNVLVKDEAGNVSVYTAVAGKTAATASGGGGGGGGSTTTTTTNNNAVVEVNGQKRDAGTSNTQTTGGQTVTTITVDDVKLNNILATSGEQPMVTLPTSTASDVIVGELSGQTIKNMEQKEATLEIKTTTVTYTLPASQINIDEVSAQLGEQVALKDVKVNVKIAEPSSDTVKIVENTANKGSYQLVVKPVEFEITCTSGSKTVEVSKFSAYVVRTVAIPDGIDPSKITTGVVLNSDGTFSHVPTTIIVVNGKYYAKINSLTNSVYSVIYNPVEFTDLASHWAKDAVNDMGSRMVVTGMGDGTYEPDRSITRAEFAAIIVRALGLQKSMTESTFTDVALADWFNGYVDTATVYALISGYDGASFGPNDSITREQAMTILARAMKLTGLSVSLTEDETAALLANYSDAGTVSDYAKTSVAMCLKAGVVTGSSSTTLTPAAYVTRAEVAAMMQRFLEKSGLI